MLRPPTPSLSCPTRHSTHPTRPPRRSPSRGKRSVRGRRGASRVTMSRGTRRATRAPASASGAVAFGGEASSEPRSGVKGAAPRRLALGRADLGRLRRSAPAGRARARHRCRPGEAAPDAWAARARDRSRDPQKTAPAARGCRPRRGADGERMPQAVLSQATPVRVRAASAQRAARRRGAVDAGRAASGAVAEVARWVPARLRHSRAVPRRGTPSLRARSDLRHVIHALAQPDRSAARGHRARRRRACIAR